MSASYTQRRLSGKGIPVERFERRSMIDTRETQNVGKSVMRMVSLPGASSPGREQWSLGGKIGKSKSAISFTASEVQRVSRSSCPCPSLATSLVPLTDERSISVGGYNVFVSYLCSQFQTDVARDQVINATQRSDL